MMVKTDHLILMQGRGDLVVRALRPWDAVSEEGPGTKRDTHLQSCVAVEGGREFVAKWCFLPPTLSPTG